VWANRYYGGFTPAMRFLDDSVARRDEEIRAQEAQRQQALEQMQALAVAQEQQQRAEEQARAARRLRWLSGGLVVILCCAVGALVFAWRQKGITDEQRKVADEQRRVAEQKQEAAVHALNACRAVEESAARAAPELRAKPEAENLLAQAEIALASTSRNEGKSTNIPGSAGLIYIQIRPTQPLEKAREIQQELIGKGFAVPDIEPLDVGPTTNTEVRYFRESEKDGADAIVSILQRLDVKNVSAKYIPGYTKSIKVKSKQYEIWFAANSFQ
jgi:hypothetical protein